MFQFPLECLFNSAAILSVLPIPWSCLCSTGFADACKQQQNRVIRFVLFLILGHDLG